MYRRYEELDSLRGLAALCVVFFHMYQVIPTNKLLKIIFEYSPLRLLISGGESVILFFVLSGFVLALPYFNNKQSNYFSFIIKRICRIYFPYLFALIVVIWCRELFYVGNLKALSGWINSFWSAPVNIQVIQTHLLMLGTFLSNLNPVLWSLVHEMRISIIFPFLMLLLVRLDWKKGLGLSALVSVMAIVLYSVFKPGDTGTEYVATLNYTAMFTIGALLAKYKSNIANKFNLLTNKIKILGLAFGLFAYLFAHPSFAIKAFIYKDISPFYRTIIDSWFVTVGAVILIIFAINSILMSRVLKNYFVNFLGKISYSLYLIHVVVILTMLQSLNGRVPISIILPGSLIVSFVIAVLMHFLIEKPSISLGKMLTSHRSKKVTFNEISR
ncbi:acyltransferase [Paenibacillus sp. N3.4]|uniref:acyltransferase family protein n=1 Tax=Paenibacillus sp. N3.4 TaxID=2603222 RepID=UPI0011CCA7F3|nr:acyltransferase [Paenibacillus sp. N3.4]TXK72270.1 acyltransferase [Paenibacillus sp. N3.4]